jgi:hypothetical protein
MNSELDSSTIYSEYENLKNEVRRFKKFPLTLQKDTGHIYLDSLHKSNENCFTG